MPNLNINISLDNKYALRKYKWKPLVTIDEGLKKTIKWYKKCLKKKALIITGNLVQDHEFIYPFYRLLEDGFEVDTCINEGKEGNGHTGYKNSS